MNVILKLMLVFSKIALGAFGGGLATIPFIHRELVTNAQWLTEKLFQQTIALAQMTPGPVALNAATFVGYRFGNFAGSLFATVALIGTPILIIAILLYIVSRGSENLQKKFAAFQKILRPAVAGLLMSAFITLARPLIPDLNNLIPGIILISIFVICYVLSRFELFKKFPQLIILFGAILGLCLKNFILG